MERPPIASLYYQILLRPGALLQIKASGLIRKISLMARILPQLAKRGY
ncbi:AAA-like domain-containing protein [Nostoc sp. TCL240-02]